MIKTLLRHFFENLHATLDLQLTFSMDRPTTNNKQQSTNNQQPTTNDQQPTTNNQQPTTNSQQPTTNNQQATTNNRQATTNNQQPTTTTPSPTTTPFIWSSPVVPTILSEVDSKVKVVPGLVGTAVMHYCRSY